MLDLRKPGITVAALCLIAGAVGCGSVRGGHQCGTDTTGAIQGNGAPFLPDGSFEDEPSGWSLQDYSSIDASQSCDLEQSLRLQLDEGLGSMSVTRSTNLENVAVSTDYTISLYYRFEHCTAAQFVFQSGNYERDLKVDGNRSEWVQLTFDVAFDTLPAWVDIHPTREGAATDFMGSDYQKNVIWIDDMRIDPK